MMKRLLILFFFILAAGFVLKAAPVSAAFNANNLIEDFVFNSTNSMSPQQINDWLNVNFPNSCISPNHGFTAPDPTGYNPSRGFIYGGPVTAGQAIYDAAQAYGINPQVLITTLQKEETLVTGNAGCATWQYASAMGFSCTDSGTNSHNYSYTNGSDAGTLPTPLYYINGNPVNSISNSCVSSAAKAGFSEQVIWAAWLLERGLQRSEGNVNWAVIKPNWDNSDEGACYGGPMTQGYLKRCSFDANPVYYDGYTTIDGQSVHMDNGATATLYWYTPHLSGNSHFNSLFQDWFGSPYKRVCEITTSNYLVPVYRIYSSTLRDHLFSSSLTERSNATTANGGYVYEGVGFQMYTNSNDGRTAVYRLYSPSIREHLYTNDLNEKNTLVSSSKWFSEGAPFYGYPSSAANLSPVYRLFSSKVSRHMFTASVSERNSLLGAGYVDEGAAWYVKTNLAAVQRLYRDFSGDHLFSISPAEAESAFATNTFNCEGVGFNASPAQGSGQVPVYRVYNSVTDEHFYTVNAAEKDSLITSGANYRGEGVVFYANNAAGAGLVPLYRLYDGTRNIHMYTADASERTSLINGGYADEGIAWYFSP